CGYQSVQFAVFTKLFAITEGLMPPDPRLNKMFELVNLERGLIFGIVTLIAGVALLLAAINQWRLAHFGQLDYSHTMRWVIPGEKPATIMDFGCGTGTSIPLFLSWPGVTQVIGTDVSAKSLDVAIATHASARAQFHLMKNYQPQANADLVFCNGVFHHIPLDE